MLREFRPIVRTDRGMWVRGPWNVDTWISDVLPVNRTPGGAVPTWAAVAAGEAGVARAGADMPRTARHAIATAAAGARHHLGKWLDMWDPFG